MSALTFALIMAATPPASAQPALARAALADPATLITTDWRTELASALATLPELRTEVSITKPLRGQIMAGTLRLPARVEITGDTTIIARHIIFAGDHVTITGKGHKLHVLPIESMQTAAAVRLRQAGLTATTSGVITIDQSGGQGATGAPGFAGSSGFPGIAGRDGTDYGPDNWCVVDIAGDGGRGSNGGAGQQGTSGNGGGNGGTIILDIPPGSTDSYVLRALGGRGGAGGPGGPGGSGGPGGRGGAGGDVYCPYGPGGRGGNGGPGGDGGPGGRGGNGHNGGNGGTITVTYPAGYDPTRISVDVSAGAAGDGGPAGEGGSPGPGGAGGAPGINNGNGWVGDSGSPGTGGLRGSQGSVGSSGEPGLPGIAIINGRNASLRLTVDKPQYEVGEQPRYEVTGGPPNTPICWSSWKDGAPVEVNACYGHQTDAAGMWSGVGNAWTNSDIGSWTKRAILGEQQVDVSFTVAPIVPVILTMDKSHYELGETATMTVTGAPNQPIFWATWHNGNLTERDVQSGVTDANGRWTGTTSWLYAFQIGTWTKQAKIGSQTGQVTVDVGHCGYMWQATKVFYPNEHYIGCGGALWMQGDGNLVIYQWDHPVWASGTMWPGSYAVFQSDGNLVIYSPFGTPLWASNTFSPGARLEFQSDGNLVIYSASGFPIWATNTAH